MSKVGKYNIIKDIRKLCSFKRLLVVYAWKMKAPP